MNPEAKKPILITGCSSGIGLCVARGLQQRGYRVFATARKYEDVERLNEMGMESLHLDLANSTTIQSAVNEILRRTNNRLYALFNNGAYGQPGAVEDLRRDVIREQFETNLFGWLELTNLVIPVMRQQRAGRIIQNSSILGIMGLPMRGAYVASKYALEGLTDTLRLELAGSGIEVSLIEPGPIESQFRHNAIAYYKKNIDRDNSVHREAYLRTEARLSRPGPGMVFTLPPEAVLKRVIHALEHPHPKVRYPVTFPTYLFAFLKRILPWRMLDRILLKVGKSEGR